MDVGGVATRINGEKPAIALEVQMRDDRRWCRVLARRLAGRLGQLDDVAAVERSSNERTAGVGEIDRRVGVAVVFAQQLIVAIGILAAAGVLAGDGDLLARRIDAFT